MSSPTKRFSFFTFLTVYFPLFLWLVLIWALSDQEGLAVHGDPTVWFYLERKGAHVFEYFVLALLLWRAVRLWTRDTYDAIIWTLVWSLWAATLDESHQTLVAGREGKPSDVFIDMIGAGLSVSVIILWRDVFFRLRKKTNKKHTHETG